MSQPLLRVVVTLTVVFGPALARGESRIGVADVALHDSGLLVGQFLTSEGEPIAASDVRITLADGRTTVARTDEQGAFAFRGATGAVRLTAAEADRSVRVWTSDTAPPRAARGVLLVREAEVTRGQRPAPPRANRFVRRSKRLLSNPIFVAGVAATAIAVPVALANDDDPASP